MTRFFIKTIFALGTMALLAASTAHAAGTPEQRRACRQDAMRLCRQFVPDVRRITACMEANRARLSPLCRRQFR
ncbi:MAG: hypothetical protein ACRC9K_18930 [Afipia sp.]